MDTQQSAMTPVFWCGGVHNEADLNVPIRLVRSREVVAILMVHSHRLKTCSHYFDERMNKSKRPTLDLNAASPSEDHFLEILHGISIDTYKDCFSRMCTSSRKDFKPDVHCNLALLQVATQIEFTELVTSMYQHLSTIHWSDDDEHVIRQCFSANYFPRDQAKELLARLEGRTRGKTILRSKIQQRIRVALRMRVRGQHGLTHTSARLLLENMFSSFRQEVDSTCEKDVVAIMSTEVKSRLATFQEDCIRSTLRQFEQRGVVKVVAESVIGFERKLEGICWGLELLLRYQHADDVIDGFLQLAWLPIIIAAATENSIHPVYNTVAEEFAKLVIFIYREVVAGHLLLGIAERVSLLENWPLTKIIQEPSMQWEIVVNCGFAQAREEVFLTLPLLEQLRLLAQEGFEYLNCISASSFATVVKRRWIVEENGEVEAVGEDAEVETEVPTVVQLQAEGRCASRSAKRKAR